MADRQRPPARELSRLPTPGFVFFDVDFTLLEPGETFAVGGYRAMGERFGLRLDASRWREAERAACEVVAQRRREFGVAHDRGAYAAIAGAVVAALGGGPPEAVRACVDAIVAEWMRVEDFALYDDVLPCLERLRDAGIRLGLVSNTSRHLDGIVARFGLSGYIEVAVASFETGLSKPSPAIFGAALVRAGVGVGDAVMVGDSVGDDVNGALACGMGAVLLDREGRYDLDLPTIRTLAELPDVLGVEAGPEAPDT